MIHNPLIPKGESAMTTNLELNIDNLRTMLERYVEGTAAFWGDPEENPPETDPYIKATYRYKGWVCTVTVTGSNDIRKPSEIHRWYQENASPEYGQLLHVGRDERGEVIWLRLVTSSPTRTRLNVIEWGIKWGTVHYFHQTGYFKLSSFMKHKCTGANHESKDIIAMSSFGIPPEYGHVFRAEQSDEAFLLVMLG